MNNTQLIGRLAKSPRVTGSGDKTRANFTLAVDGYGTQPTSWIPVTCFGRTAENVAEYTDRGHLVAIEGRITSGRYTNDAGETVFTLDVIANRVEFLKAPKSATTTPEPIEADEIDAA